LLFFNSSKMSYYNQNQALVGAPPPQGYPQSYPPPPQGYPPAGYPQQGYPPQGGPTPETQSRGDDGFLRGFVLPCAIAACWMHAFELRHPFARHMDLLR
ncbi:hypothetical protein KI387_020679, partial [Taxus chinensis]